MIKLAPEVRKRKVLTLPIPRASKAPEPTFIPREDASYMVWREGGDMPKKLYSDPHLPYKHAMLLAKQYPGERFHVLRSWRICSAKDA